jgi:predicted RNA-binding Zn-ribbon protein involved in translation (DUF1610 family)
MKARCIIGAKHLPFIRVKRMFDLDKATFNFPCPNCGFENPARIRQVRTASRVICRGCKANLQLGDATASVKKERTHLMKQLASINKKVEINIKL